MSQNGVSMIELAIVSGAPDVVLPERLTIPRKLKYRNTRTSKMCIEQSIDQHENVLHWVMLIKHVFEWGVFKLYVSRCIVTIYVFICH